jgi:hypothetical protein
LIGEVLGAGFHGCCVGGFGVVGRFLGHGGMSHMKTFLWGLKVRVIA